MDESRQVAAPVEPKAAREANEAAPPQPAPPGQATADEPPPSPDAAAMEPAADDRSGEVQAHTPYVVETETEPVMPEAEFLVREPNAAQTSLPEEAAPQVGEPADASSESGSQDWDDALAVTSPPPLWGRDREGGNPEHRREGVPPPLTPPHEGEGNPVAAVAEDAAHLAVDRDAVFLTDDTEAVAGTPLAPAQPQAEEVQPAEIAETDAADANPDAPEIAAGESRGPSVVEPAGPEALPVAPTSPTAPQAELGEPEQSRAEGEAQPPDMPQEPEPALAPPTHAEAAVARAVPAGQPTLAAPLPASHPPERALGPARTWQPSLPARETVARALPYVRLAVRGAAVLAVGYVAVVLLLIVLYRWVDPPMSTLMLGQRLTGTPIERRWVALDRISPHLIRAVVLSEDGGFCRHRGVDLTALEEAIERDRGGSTITMQVVKNLFLWPSRSYVRKAIEICLAYVVELVWPKRRILEIYLNIAEWGDGVFGAEAAARQHFLKSASRLTAEEAALLAVSLPNPLERIPASPSITTRRLAQRLLTRMQVSRASLACVRTPRPVKAGQGPLVAGPRLTL